MSFINNKGLLITSLIWMVAICAALYAALIQGFSISLLTGYVFVALIPAVLGVVLWPFSNREWAQVVIILSWIMLAIFACIAIKFVPMAVLFLCAPAAASLFERERVIEAMVFSAIFAGLVFYAGEYGFLPEPIADRLQGGWGRLAGIAGTVSFLLGALFFASSQSKTQASQKDIETTNTQEAELPTIRNFPRPALIFSKDGLLVEASDPAMEMFELTAEDFGDMKLDTVFAADKQVARRIFETIRKANTTKQVQSEDFSLAFASEDKGHHIRYLTIDAVPREGVYVDVFLTDVSRHRQELDELKGQFRRTDTTESDKTLFFAGVSHELRTPLNAIIGFSDMMRSRLFGPLPGKYSEYADLIHDSGQHMLDLIGDVLDLSKIDAGKYTLHYGEFDAADVIRSSVKMVRPSADAAQVALQVDIKGHDDLLINADRKAVRQILLNLLSNAIKFSPKGGHVTVHADVDHTNLNISIADVGAGMTTRELAMIGKPYAQTKGAAMIDARGSGLGLSLVKTLVDLHAGEFSIHSKPDEGTQVLIHIPLDRARAAND